jgi:hypothetical protein
LAVKFAHFLARSVGSLDEACTNDEKMEPSLQIERFSQNFYLCHFPTVGRVLMLASLSEKKNVKFP